MAEQSPFQLLLALDQAYRNRAASLPAQQEVAQYWSGIGFRMGGQHYVAPLGEIVEVLPEPRFTQLPGVRSWVRGVANVRGRLLPVMDLCAFLGMNLSGTRKERRVLVVEHGNLFAGLTVDTVLGMQHFKVESFSADCGTVPAGVQAFVRGCFQREHDWLIFSPYALAVDTAFLDVVA